MKQLSVLLSLTFLVVLCCQSEQNIDPSKLDEFIDLDNKSLEEIEEELESTIEKLEAFAGFFSEPLKESKEEIPLEEERYAPPFKIDSSNSYKFLNQFQKIRINQEYEDNASEIGFNFSEAYKRLEELNDGMSQRFLPKVIYYNDGNVDTTKVKDYAVDFNFSNSWGPPKHIDSIKVAYSITYIKQTDSVILSDHHPKVDAYGGTITLKELDYNYVYLTLSDTIPPYAKIETYNAQGKSLDRSSYFKSGSKPGDGANDLDQVLDVLKTIKSNIEDEDYDTVEDLKIDLLKKANGVKALDKTSNLRHHEYIFKGTPTKIKLFFKKTTATKDTLFTAVNYEPAKEINLMTVAEGDSLQFFNKKGDVLFTVKDDYMSPIAGKYFEDSDHFYFIDYDAKKVDTLLYYDIFATDNKLVVVKENDYNDFDLYTSVGKKLPYEGYDYETYTKNYVLLSKDNTFYLVNHLGEAKQLSKSIAQLHKETEDYVIVSNTKGKYGLINPDGNVIIPMKYNAINEFSDGLISVKKDDYYGFFNEKGKQVLPFKYESVYKFITGITCAKFDGSYKLINKKGEVLVDTQSSMVMISENFGERMYSFGTGNYDTYGKLIVKKEE